MTPKMKNLRKAPAELADAVSAYLLPNLVSCNAAQQLQYGRLFLHAVAQAVGVQGASFAALAITTLEDAVEKASRVLALLLPDAAGIQRACTAAWESVVAMCPNGPVQVAVSPLPTPQSSPARSVTSGLSDDVAAAALKQLSDQALKQKPWRSSRDFQPDDGFTPEELAALQTVFPEYGWSRDDDNADLLTRCVKAMATHYVAGASSAPAQLARILRTEMRVARRSFAPTHIGGLQLALTNGDDRSARILLAELSLVANEDVHEDILPRILLAREMRRTSAKECTSILLAKTKTVTAVADLPLQLREKISRMS